MIRDKIDSWLLRRFPEYQQICVEGGRENSSWESWASTDIDYWWDKPEAERLIALADLWTSDPEAAFRGYKALADESSVHAMIWLGHCYDRGHGTEANADKAYDSFSRAIVAGSWVATLDLAALLFKGECFDECEAYLEECLSGDYIPAYYWLARYRLQRSKTRATYLAVKPLLTRAADEGHPGARGLLAADMLIGKFGWREIPQGFRLMREDFRQFRRWREEAEKMEQISVQPNG